MVRKLIELVVLIKGAGEVASAVAHRLHRSHFRVCLTEIASPLAVSRGTCYSEAVFNGRKTIEGVTGELVAPDMVRAAWERSHIAVVIDPRTTLRERLAPDVLVDATMMKTKTQTRLTDAPLVIGIGSGFTAGEDVHIVIESNNSTSLGRVLLEGQSEVNTGVPVNIAGLTRERVVWADRAGVFTSDRELGQTVAAGEVIARLDDAELKAPLGGMLRGLLRSGVRVPAGAKLIEVDPVNDSAVCYIIRDRMRAIAGGVLEAIMLRFNQPQPAEE